MTTADDDTARRAYWTQQMDLGHALVQEILGFEVRECGEGLASIREAAASGGVAMQFSDSKIAGDLDRVFFLREGLIEPLLQAARAMNQRGWILKIEDGYRSLQMQRQLVRKPEVFDAILEKCIWEHGGRLPAVELVFRRGVVLVANLPKIGTHMSGSAVDISVWDRRSGREVWRGGPYLEMSERTPMRSPWVDQESLKNRLEITSVMESHGFFHFPYEFWHYNGGDALGHILSGNPAPARYGPVDWDPQTGKVTPCEDPLAPLNPLATIEQEVAAALERAAKKRG